MNQERTHINQLVVQIFNDIMQEEEKTLIVGEFKNISVNDMHIIEAIGIDSPKNMSKIAGILNITVGTLTIAINNLLKKGYVIRKRSEKDRRVVFISLSEAGERAYYHHMAYHQGIVERLTADLSKEEIAVLEKALGNMADQLHE
ncbi:MAG: MarR family transcriptional regulator [Lachnospiraceae bacterium]|nr:MarR family transcriptional regulator [Lachnospiraceae bacterium]